MLVNKDGFLEKVDSQENNEEMGEKGYKKQTNKTQWMGNWKPLRELTRLKMTRRCGARQSLKVCRQSALSKLLLREKNVLDILGAWGDAGMADGQDGTLKKKIVKRPLGSESVVPPAPIMGRKEGQRNSDLDQPGKAQGLKKLWRNEVHICTSPSWIISKQFYSFSLH